MIKFSVAVLLFAGVATAYPLQGTIKGFGLQSPIANRRQQDSAAVAGSTRSRDSYAAPAPAPAPSPSYGPSKGGSKTQQPVLRPKPSQKIGPVSAAVITSRSQEVINVPASEDIVTPQVVIIEPNVSPITIEFRSQSSPVNIQQVHIPGPRGQVKTTKSEEPADKLIHEVLKPVIQEVREIIQPYRKITQQILPVQEEVHSVVSKGERKQTVEEAQVPKVEIPEEPEQEEVQQEEQQQAESTQSEVLAASSGTVVQAGLIGGARVMPVEDESALLAASNQRRGLKIRK